MTIDDNDGERDLDVVILEEDAVDVCDDKRL